MNKKAEYIIIDGDIYSISEEIAKCVKAAYDLTKAFDEDTTDVINTIKKYGKFIGSAFMTVRT